MFYNKSKTETMKDAPKAKTQNRNSSRTATVNITQVKINNLNIKNAGCLAEHKTITSTISIRGELNTTRDSIGVNKPELDGNPFDIYSIEGKKIKQASGGGTLFYAIAG